MVHFFRRHSLLFLCTALLAGIGMYVWTTPPLNKRIKPPQTKTVQGITVPVSFDHSGKSCSIDFYGAKEDDAAATKKAFEKAFADCAPGGTVVVPDGTWQTGAVHMLSDTTLHLSGGAVLSFDTDPDMYLPAVPTRFEGLDVMNFSPLIYARDCKNVAITGSGKLVGNGKKWWKWNDSGNEKSAAQYLYALSEKDAPLKNRVFANPEQPLRPSFVQFYNCENIVMDGFTVEDGPMWTIHPVYSKNVSISNVTVHTTGPNTDGIALDSVDTAVVENSTLSCGDDCIVIKSGLDYDGWKQNKPSRNILVSNVLTTNGRGGITIGSEMSGGIENIAVENSSFTGMNDGIRIKTVSGRGGYIRNIFYKDISMHNVTNNAISIDTDYRYATVDSSGDKDPDIRGITIENLTAGKVGKSITIKGRGEAPIRALTLKDITMQYEGKTGRIQDIDGATIENVKLSEDGTRSLIFENAQNVSISGTTDFLLNGSKYAEIRGPQTNNIHISLTPCPDGSCIMTSDGADLGKITFDESAVTPESP